MSMMLRVGCDLDDSWIEVVEVMVDGAEWCQWKLI
jgi:hypothetical protein